MEDVFDIQDEIARSIVGKLRIQLTGDRILVKRYTENLEAYSLCLQGFHHQWQLTRQGLNKSIDFFEQAFSQDPSYALACAGLSVSYCLLGFHGMVSPQEVMPKAREMAQKALGIDNSLAEAHLSLAVVLFLSDWDWPAAEHEFRLALELNPQATRLHEMYAVYLSLMARPEEAVAEAKRAVELDPVSSMANSVLANAFVFARRFDEAIIQCHKGLDLNPNYLPLYWHLQHAHIAKGSYNEALETTEKAASLVPTHPAIKVQLASVYALAGKRKDAINMLNELLLQREQRYLPAWHIAAIYYRLGDTENAFQLFETAYEERDGLLLILYAFFMYDPLRDDPRFKDLMRRMNFPE